MAESVQPALSPSHRPEWVSRWIVVVWLVILGTLLWNIAQRNDVPPVWDSLTYVVKARNVWDAIATGHLVNPFAVGPTVRPPGTVLASYPFGFGNDFNAFLFRTQFVPAVLIAIAVLIVAGTRSRRAGLVTAAVAVACSSLPAVFQLQASDTVRYASYWGLVDLFMTGVAALSSACMVRAVAGRSALWAGAAAVAAVICFWTKPAGALVMASLLAGWAALAVVAGWSDRASAPRLVLHFGMAAALCCLGFAAGWASPYFSAHNLAFGRQVLAVMRSMSAGFSGLQIVERLHVSTGWPVVACLVAGCALAAARRRTWALVACAIVPVVLGAGFWIHSGDIYQVRYWMPFVLMGTMPVVPILLDTIERRPGAVQIVLSALMVAPAIASAALMTVTTPSLPAQRALGINLNTGYRSPHVAQAQRIIASFEERDLFAPKVYYTSTSAAMQALVGRLEYYLAIERPERQLQTLLPFDWSRGFAIQLNDLQDSDYLAYDPVEGGTGELPDVSTFDRERAAIVRWLDGLGPGDGIRRHPPATLRVIEVVDRVAFERAIAALYRSRSWRPVVSAAYSDEIVPVTASPPLIEGSPAEPIGLHFAWQGGTAVTVGYVSGRRVDRDLVIDLWANLSETFAASAGRDWRLFAQAVASGTGQQSYGDVALDQSADGGAFRRYRVVLRDAALMPESQVTVGIVRRPRYGDQPAYLNHDRPAWPDPRLLTVPIAPPGPDPAHCAGPTRAPDSGMRATRDGRRSVEHCPGSR